jgi:hypothetical protein
MKTLLQVNLPRYLNNEKALLLYEGKHPVEEQPIM